MEACRDSGSPFGLQQYLLESCRGLGSPFCQQTESMYKACRR